MSEIYKEEILNISGSSSSYAIMTLAENVDAPIIVQFNAGLLHRSEPFRLNTELARRAAEAGFHAVRFDVAGNGDADVRSGMDERSSILADWDAVRTAIELRLNAVQTPRKYIFMGLCSGADNSIKVASVVKETCGLILLDPAPPGGSINKRSILMKKLLNPWFWLRFPLTLVNRFFSRQVTSGPEVDEEMRDYHYDGLPARYGNRALPGEDELSQVLSSVTSSGSVLSVFTSYSSDVIWREQQIASHLELSHNQRENFEEIYFPDMEHLFALAEHREELLKTVTDWLKRSNF